MLLEFFFAVVAAIVIDSFKIGAKFVAKVVRDNKPK